MARILFCLMLVFQTTGIFAQFGTVIVFSPSGEEFFLYINGKQKNNEAATRVETDNPGGPSFKIKITFKDATIKEVGKMVFNKPHSTMYYKLEKNAKGNFVIESTSGEPTGVKTTENKESRPETRETSQDKSASGEIKTEEEKSAKNPEEKRCDSPMADVDFAVALGGVSSSPFEASQLNSAKKMTEKNCLTTFQVRQVMEIFDFESTRLTYAKFAYGHTYDKENYGDVKEALHTEKAQKELESYITTNK